MRVAITGGGGLMALTIMRDLIESSTLKDIHALDYREDKARDNISQLKDSRLGSGFVDVTDIEKTAKAIKGYDIVINSTSHYFNINVMKACLEAKSHYIDLGGLFHFTMKQLKLHEDFRKAGLTAVLCIGGQPGITNVMARYAYDRLDKVEAVAFSDACSDMTDTKGIDVFMPGYSIRTIMEEYSLEPVEFIDGKFKTLPPLSGAKEIDFPEPFGRRTCIHTLHSEPATVPVSFQDKGVKEVTWRLSLPSDFEKKAMFLASLGFGHGEPINVHGKDIIPIEVLEAVIEKQIKDKIRGIKIKPNDAEICRAHVIGRKDGKRTEYMIDCVAKTHTRWGISSGGVIVGVSPSVTAHMIFEGRIAKRGVFPPETIIDPEYFFRELSKREMSFSVIKKEEIL
jgi:saccharopine dehydrogenase-like NADP-dependent oxidoreductase